MKELFEQEKSGAIFSECRRYRYVLWRIWDESKPFIQFVGLNPSTASENMDDPTIRRVKRFAKDWGFGGVFMTNLFGIVSSDPAILKTCEDPVGENDKWLLDTKNKCITYLFAWGNFDVFGRDKTVAGMFLDPICLGLNKNGSPKHPLYIAADTKPTEYSLITNTQKPM